MRKSTRFLDAQKNVQAALKSDARLFSPAAHPNGPYSLPTAKRPQPNTYPFCLPLDAATENLFAGARGEIDRFAGTPIPWHKGVNGGPTTHMCSSQVCCVNFLSAFSSQPDALLSLVRELYPDAEQMVPVDPRGEGEFVEFEWIGDPEANYLDEGRGPNKRRTRGANATSADAAVRYADGSGNEHVLLIEWKYCESYDDLSSISLAARLLSLDPQTGTETRSAGTRRSRYEHLLSDVAALPDGVTFDDLCVEPLYQLMRQQMLAYAMEQSGEAASVRVLHLSPASNADFKRITSDTLRDWAEATSPGEPLAVTDAWRRLLIEGERFEHRTIEGFFAPQLEDPSKELAEWAEYVSLRYPWTT